ncbi:hypothetical protein EDC04DRAFT_2589594 [Pisolithus marmoratus]|nr:hypothetical protein EDC04DRAFT_2589594 [Pisolithus marmoratus]
MVELGADTDTLTHFQELLKGHLTVDTAAFTQNGHEHWHSNLPWFWSMDIPRDTTSKCWLTEFYQIHWLQAKACKDRWAEEEELLNMEFQWVINFFKYHTRKWNDQYLAYHAVGMCSAACYAAWQQVVYDQLSEQGESKWQAINEDYNRDSTEICCQ